MASKLPGTRCIGNVGCGLACFGAQVSIGKKDQAQRDKITHEVQLLSQLNHPNIIKIHAAWEDKKRGMMIFITELMTSGTLRDFLTNQSTCVCRALQGLWGGDRCDISALFRQERRTGLRGVVSMGLD